MHKVSAWLQVRGGTCIAEAINRVIGDMESALCSLSNGALYNVVTWLGKDGYITCTHVKATNDTYIDGILSDAQAARVAGLGKVISYSSVHHTQPYTSGG